MPLKNNENSNYYRNYVRCSLLNSIQFTKFVTWFCFFRFIKNKLFDQINSRICFTSCTYKLCERVQNESIILFRLEWVRKNMCKRTNGHEIKFILSAIHRDHHDICVTMYRWNSVKNGTKELLVISLFFVRWRRFPYVSKSVSRSIIFI